MPRLLSTAILIAIFGGGGWMFFKGLHLEDIKQIVVSGNNSGSFDAPQFGGFEPPPAWSPEAGATIKIATFNIEVFGDAKADKPYVLDELAKILSRFDVVAIQEIRTQDDLFIQKFCRRIYELTGRKYDSRVGPRLGNTTNTEQYAFLFDIARVRVHPDYVYTIRDPENLLHREPLVAMFATRGVPIEQAFTFILINVHTDPDLAGEEMDAVAQVYQVVRRSGMGEDDVIVLGDFNTDVAVSGGDFFGRSARSLRPDDLHGLGRISGIYPVVQNQPTNAVQTKLHDNILFHRPSTSEFTGRGGVYDVAKLHNLSLDQVQQVSDHLPVWAEFTVTESGLPGRMAAGAGPAVR